MQTRSDAELLRDYIANRSEAAFGEIVRRYADFVYSAALRQVGNEQEAHDASQIVFTDLARKAGVLKKDMVLIGWLCNAARLAAMEILRKDQRRLQRERLSMDLLHSSETPDDWSAVRPVLDLAIARLGHDDRNALLLRFFKNESLATIGAALGISEDAAQKRVSRALEKLRGFLAERGIHTSAAALAGTLIVNGVQAAPTGLAASLAASALTKTAAAGSTAASVVKLLTVSNMKSTIVILGLAAVATGLTFKQLSSRRQLRESRALVQQQRGELDSLRAANARLAGQTNELERLRGDAKDVLRLRAEVTRLRRDLADQKAAMALVAAASNSVALAPEPQVNIHCKFVTLPQEYGRMGMAGILNEAQREAILKSLAQVEGADLIGDQQVTTLSGREAQISTADDALAADGYPNIGPILTVTATCSTNSPAIRLKLIAELRELMDSATPQRGSLPVVEVTAVTNTTTVWDGQTLVLSQKLSRQGSGPDALGASRPRNLFVFVTPTMIDPAGNRIYSDQRVSSESNSGETSEGFTSPGTIPGLPR